MRNNSGFTLIELAVIIAIIGVLAGIAVPSFVGWLPKYRLISSADDIQSLVQNARLRAVKENAHVAVLFDPDNDGLDGDYLAFVDTEFRLEYGCGRGPGCKRCDLSWHPYNPSRLHQ